MIMQIGFSDLSVEIQ